MLDELLDLYDDYVSHNKYADKYFVNQVFIIISKYHDLGEYLENVYVTKKNSEYLPLDKVIKIGLKEIYQITNRTKYMLNEDYVYLFNLIVIETIFHELEHVFQAQKKDKGPDDVERYLLTLSDPLKLCSIFLENKNVINFIKFKLQARRQIRYYQKKHDLSPDERIAEIQAYKNTFNLINRYKSDSKGLVLYHDISNKLLSYTLLNGYKIVGDMTNSPSLDYIKGMKGIDNKEHVKDKILHDLSIPSEKRLLYGLELTIDEFSDVLDNIKKKIIIK